MTAASARLTQGPVRSHLIAQTVPMIWGIAAVMSLNIVDTWFVAQLGEQELAAISFTFPVTMVLISLGIGLMAGTASVISRGLGKGNISAVQRLTTDAVLLGLLLAIICTFIGLLSMDSVFRAMGADEDLLPLIRDYMTIWYLGFVFFLVPMIGLGAIRAAGESKLQSNIMLAVAVLNLILDPLLIFGLGGFPRMEIEGAALASIIARALSFFAGYWALRKKQMITFIIPNAAEFLSSCRRVLHVGLPAAGTNIIIPMATGVVVAMVATYGSNAVAGYGAATRMEQITLVMFYAMSAMIGPFVGQNLGAGNYDRIEKAARLCWRFCLLSGLVMAVVLILIGPYLMALFSTNQDVIEAGSAYLLIVPISFGLEGVVMVINAAFNGFGKPFPAVAISVARMVLLYVPLAYLFSMVWGMHGIFIGAALANMVSGILAWSWFKKLCKEHTLAHRHTNAGVEQDHPR